MGRCSRWLAALLCATPLLAAVPIVHITDLYHGPGDPDDHFDLATLFALPEFDIRGILIDVRPPKKAGKDPYEPGFVPVAQLSYLTGRPVPVAVGPSQPLKSPRDAATDRSEQEQSAIRLLLDILRASREPVVVSAVGSCRIPAAAYLRDPELFRRKVKVVLINSGSAGTTSLEHNVQVDVASYITMFRSGLPVWWFPCAGQTTDWNSPQASGDHNTFWRANHADLLRELPKPLANYFAFALTRSSRGDILRALDDFPEEVAQPVLQNGTRNLWSIASLVMVSGRVLAKTSSGWRFLPKSEVGPGMETEVLALDTVNVTIDDAGQTSWQATKEKTNFRLFRRHAGPGHSAAMTEALNQLLRSMKTR